jgi:hypothetical protein
MKTSSLFSIMTKCALVQLLITTMVVATGSRWAFASEEAPEETGSRFLVLSDNDYDGPKAAPARDTVDMVDSRGEFIRTVANGLNVTGPCSLSISEDGRLFAVCDRGANMLAVYEVATGRKVWSLLGVFDSAAFSNGSIYALNTESTYVIDSGGVIIKHARIGGFDFAIDRSNSFLWVSGFRLNRCNLDLEGVWALRRAKVLEGPSRLELNSDDSVWLAQRDFRGRYYSDRNRLMKISPEGRVLRSVHLEFGPLCVRADEFGGGIWVTGMIEGRRDFSCIGHDWPDTFKELDALTKMPIETVTQRFDSEGRLILSIPEGGNSLVVDPLDGSVWIMTGTSISHFSFEGKKLDIPADLAAGHKWLARMPTR